VVVPASIARSSGDTRTLGAQIGELTLRY
jgi:hypothetical protein